MLPAERDEGERTGAENYEIILWGDIIHLIGEALNVHDVV